MPTHLSANGKTVLDPNGKPVPGGEHKDHASALAHEQAININTRREEGKPVAPKLDDEKFNAKHDEHGQFAAKNPTAPIGGAGAGHRMESKKPKPQPQVVEPEQKASWLADPTDDELYQWLVNEDMGEYLPNYFKQQNYDPGNGIDRAHYHPVNERFNYVSSPDWNDDTAIALPETWVLAHPFGDPRNQDQHDEHFDKKTNFYEKDNLLPQVPVSYYHNFNPDGTPSGDPMAIGKTIKRKYLPAGRWDKIHFDQDIPPEIKSRLAKAISNGTLRASPTVVPDFHKVDDQTGHIDNWLTGSIAVFDAQGDRQPANARAIGIPAMKALFKQAHLQFPKHLEVKMGKTTKAAPTWKARVLKAVIKALGEENEEANSLHAHPDGSQHENHEGYATPHEHDETGAMKALETQGQNLVDDTSSRARFEGAGLANVEKDVQPLPDIREVLEEEEEATERGNPLKDQDVKLDWKPETKRMKAIVVAQANQLKALQARADNGDFSSWVSEQLVAGKVVPAEVEDLRADYLQALADDRTSHPVMKAQDGKPISRVARLKSNVERRTSHFGEMDLTGEQMKALGLQMGSLNFDQTKSEKPFTEARKQELLNASPLGAKIVQDKQK
jgi:hypothetical protein